MQVAIDASRITVRRRTGTENYALQMIRSLLELEASHHYQLYFRDAVPPDLLPDTRNYTSREIPFPRMWTHLRFAAELWRRRPDIIWVPAHTLPRFFPGNAVVTVHDLGYLHFPDAHPEKERRYLDWSTRYSARRATFIMADSEATKHDLVQFYDIEPEKIRVVYAGTDESLLPVRDQVQLLQVRQKYGLPEKYLLFLGTLQPRKNIARLVEAFGQWQRDSDRTDIGLVLGGKPGWLYDPAWVQGVENVYQTGYVEDTDVAALYSGALGFVMPSLYEGFGFPILEAMRCKVPVLCSNTSSLPELAGEAAILVDPTNTDSIAGGIRRLVTDETLRQQLIEQGKTQVQKFTWRKAAQAALTVLEEAAQP